ncbi:MAG: hypothetical protein K8L99_24780 [Anaerolineae bacterium]|nr:hypothetical protein [Anaerolineae bacterium]
MSQMAKQFAPYFRNGLLYFPVKTVDILVMAGLDQQTGWMLQNGLSLDDQVRIDQIRKAVELVTLKAKDGSALHMALTSPEARFMLTNMSAQVF